MLVIKCFDVTGRMVFEDDNATKKSKAEIDLSTFRSGIYMLKIQSNKELFTTKIIKE